MLGESCRDGGPERNGDSSLSGIGPLSVFFRQLDGGISEFFLSLLGLACFHLEIMRLPKTRRCSVAQSCSRVRLFVTPPPMDCSTPGFPVLHYLLELAQTPVHWVDDAIHLVLSYPLLLLPSFFPGNRVFSISRLFASGGQSIGASASVLPMNIQDWFPSGLTGWISLLRDSQETFGGSKFCTPTMYIYVSFFLAKVFIFFFFFQFLKNSL